MVALSVLCVFAALLGSVPFSLLLAKSRGVDLRKVGSGNPGATNVARNLGKRLGLIALLLDMLKGFIPAMIARLLFGLEDGALNIGLVMLFAVMGHMYSVFLRLRGGKGVATALGTFLAVCPVAALIGTALYVSIYAMLRISSLGSIALTISAPATMLLVGTPCPVITSACGIALLILVKHIPNLKRLLRGEEGRV